MLQVEDNAEHNKGRGDRDGKLCKSIQTCSCLYLIFYRVYLMLSRNKHVVCFDFSKCFHRGEVSRL